MAEDVVAVNVIARDGASATLARISKETRLLGGSAAKAGGPMTRLSNATGGLVTPTTLAIGGAVALTTELIAATKAAAEDEKSQALLKAALEANIPSYKGNTDAIENVISSRMRLGFADDEQREGLRQLVAVTRDESKALDLQRTAMDLARLRGIDLTTASTLLGKVYGGNIGILARYGIQLAKGTTATEALAEIQRRAAGQAEAYGNTLSGQAESIGIQFGELQETIGRGVTPVLSGMASGLNDLANSLHEAGEATAGFIRPMVLAIKEAGNAKEEFKDLEVVLRHGSSAMTEDWASGWLAIADTVHTEGGFIVSGVEETVGKAAEAAGQIGPLGAQAILENQFHFNDAVDELRNYMENYLTPKNERMRIKAFLASKAVAEGLASGRPAVVRETERLVAAAQARLDALDGHHAGLDAANTYISGMAEGIRAGVGTIGDALYYLKVNSIGGSLPRSGPMMGTELDKGARSIAERFTGSLSAGLRSGMDTPSLVGSGAMARGGGYAGGGVVVNINSTFPPTPAQADEIARRLFPAMERRRRNQSH